VDVIEIAGLNMTVLLRVASYLGYACELRHPVDGRFSDDTRLTGCLAANAGLDTEAVADALMAHLRA
jgi:hypothetical protein